MESTFMDLVERLSVIYTQSNKDHRQDIRYALEGMLDNLEYRQELAKVARVERDWEETLA
jgi:hypothetical protein